LRSGGFDHSVLRIPKSMVNELNVDQIERTGEGGAKTAASAGKCTCTKASQEADQVMGGAHHDVPEAMYTST
jgi:hypothetical protein